VDVHRRQRIIQQNHVGASVRDARQSNACALSAGEIDASLHPDSRTQHRGHEQRKHNQHARAPSSLLPWRVSRLPRVSLLFSR
jgi:hypothetical protein